MSRRYNQGFGVVEIIAVVVVVGLLGLVAYKFWDASQNKAATDSSTTSVSNVESAKDLDTVDKELDAVDVSSNFEKELDSAGSF